MPDNRFRHQPFDEMDVRLHFIAQRQEALSVCEPVDGVGMELAHRRRDRARLDERRIKPLEGIRVVLLAWHGHSMPADVRQAYFLQAFQGMPPRNEQAELIKTN